MAIGAIIGGAVIGGGMSLAGASMQANAQENAASEQAQSAQSQLALQKQMWQQNQKNQQPFMTAGTNAMNILSNPNQLYSQFKTDPSYQFALQQGNQNILAQGAGTGMYGSGNMGIALENYGSGLASQQFNSYVNREQNLAALGQASASGVGAQGLGYANAMTGSMQYGANAQASGTIGAANAYAGAMNQGGSLMGSMGNYYMLQNMMNGSSGGSGMPYQGYMDTSGWNQLSPESSAGIYQDASADAYL